jgi:hypothetical protein
MTWSKSKAIVYNSLQVMSGFVIGTSEFTTNRQKLRPNLTDRTYVKLHYIKKPRITRSMACGEWCSAHSNCEKAGRLMRNRSLPRY